jgi:hypothetical protein
MRPSRGFGRKYFGPDLGLKTPVSKVLRSEAEVNFDEPTQKSAFQGTTKPTTH